MWRSLRDQQLLSIYEGEFSEPSLRQLLSWVVANPRFLKSPLYAVTSHGKLRFTLAPNYAAEKRFPAVYVIAHAGGYGVWHVPAGAHAPDGVEDCTEAELCRVVEQYLDRLLCEDGASR